MEQVSVLIVEDKSVVAEDIKTCLEGFGYYVCGISSNGDDAIRLTNTRHPDLVLMDINLKGPMDGIAVAQFINKTTQVPVIFLTAYSDQLTVERAKASYPYAYIVKPFDPFELKTAVDIAIQNYLKFNEGITAGSTADIAAKKNGAVFIKQGEAYKKVAFSSILYLEADGSYTRVHTPEGPLTIATNLKHVQYQLPEAFCKVHRSFVVNLEAVTGFDYDTLIIGDALIPVSRSYREVFDTRFPKLQ